MTSCARSPTASARSSQSDPAFAAKLTQRPRARRHRRREPAQDHAGRGRPRGEGPALPRRSAVHVSVERRLRHQDLSRQQSRRLDRRHYRPAWSASPKRVPISRCSTRFPMRLREHAERQAADRQGRERRAHRARERCHRRRRRQGGSRGDGESHRRHRRARRERSFVCRTSATKRSRSQRELAQGSDPAFAAAIKPDSPRRSAARI